MRKEKKKRHQMPPLSVLDQIIYWTIFVVLCLACFALIFVFMLLRERIAFSDDTVIASAENASSLWSIVPLLTVQILILVLWIIPYEARRPIFGLKNFKYGPPAWPKIYPLFMKNKPPVWVSERKKKEKQQIAIALAVLLLISFIPFPWSLYGRDCLYTDGSVRQYSMFNTLNQEHLPGDMERVEYSVYRYSSGRYGNGTHWGIRMHLVTADGRKYIFEDRDFRSNWLGNMADLSRVYDPGILFSGDPEDLQKAITDRKLSPGEIQQLKQLFGLNR